MDISQRIKKEVDNKYIDLDNRVKTSFSLIRQDLTEMQNTIKAMRKYLKKKDRQYNELKKDDDKVRAEFKRDVDDFTQDISQLKLALEAVKKLKKEVVTRKDLAQIEERIKTSFKNDIENYKQQISELKSNQKDLLKRVDALESGYVKEKKKVWIFRKKDQED